MINKKEIKQKNKINEMRRGCNCNLSLTDVLTAPRGLANVNKYLTAIIALIHIVD